MVSISTSTPERGNPSTIRSVAGGIVVAHDAPAYAEKIVQDGLVRDADGGPDDVPECHAGRSPNHADALKDHLDLVPRVLWHRAVQMRTDPAVAEQDPGVWRNLHAVGGIGGMGTNSIVERMGGRPRCIRP